jgi:radical SAM superfamily enzyme YgiQ (UPF0313 family)
MKNTISFIHSPNIRYDQNYGTLFPPVWAYTLAAHLPLGWESRVFDCTFEPLDRVADSLVFAFSGQNQDLEPVLDAHSILKTRFPKSLFIIGGPMTWSLQQEDELDHLQPFDHIFILDGEETLPNFLNQIIDTNAPPPEKIISGDRFDLGSSRAMKISQDDFSAQKYYGTIIEVSRGCPFLCEFCDIRVLPNNNRSHNKPINLIIEEIDFFARLGVTQFQFACDNFIGDLNWARECVDAILEWKTQTNISLSIFTWLTLNLFKDPNLMENMRRAGFSILFIGLESVNENSLLETAKVQNSTRLEEAVRAIQSFGFIIAPGFIFGFDSDPDSIFQDTLNFLETSGLIGGDPSFLMALPGTPLYRRMKNSSRLVINTTKPTNREKISTNIRYLQDSESLVMGFLSFIKTYNSADFQFHRYKNHLESLAYDDSYIDTKNIGYGSPIQYLRLQFRDSTNRKFLFGRILFLLEDFRNLLAFAKAWRLTKRYSKNAPGLISHFNYWIYAWTNMHMKYKNINHSDFSLHSVGKDFNYSNLIDQELEREQFDLESIGPNSRKAAHQSKFTRAALLKLAEQNPQHTLTETVEEK